MKVLSVNVDGIQSAAQWGLFKWLQDIDADVVCLQNTQAKLHQLPSDFEYPPGYNAYYFDAEPDNYSGVAIFCKETPKAIMTGMSFDACDRFGRYIQADFEKLSVGSLLCPIVDTYNTLDDKIAFLQQFAEHCHKTRRKRREFIFAGSYYVAPQSEDVQNAGASEPEPGLLDIERDILTEILGPVGMMDTFREANFGNNQFSWWPTSENAKLGTCGRRFDLQISTPGFKGLVVSAKILSQYRFGLHAPVLIEYETDDLSFSQLHAQP